jgi:hypothetical protein
MIYINEKDLFRQPAPSRFDDASHQDAGETPETLIPPGWRIWPSSPECLFQANRGFDPRGNRRCSPESGGEGELRLERLRDRAIRDGQHSKLHLLSPCRLARAYANAPAIVQG